MQVSELAAFHITPSKQALRLLAVTPDQHLAQHTVPAHQIAVLLSALLEGAVSKEGLSQLANQAVSDELVHLLANTDIRTGQLCLCNSAYEPVPLVLLLYLQSILWPRGVCAYVNDIPSHYTQTCALCCTAQCSYTKA